MTTPKFKRLKTLNTADDDRRHPITTVTSATSASAILYLPDNVIERIISFLPMKHAVQATAASKHWASLWPSFPVIDFDEGDSSVSDDPAKFQRFLRFLENCIHRCRNQRSLDKLRLRVLHGLAGDDSVTVTVDKCVTFALERCVKDLELCFVEKAENEVSFYLIPQAVFSSHFLTSLNLEKVRISLSSRDIVNDALTLLSLRTMSLKEARAFGVKSV
ncbi:putative FBD-associated F-box protein At5g22720 [Argentina anserina]|uniref:putative FBD-associated F-box protein At5g22720 n=1 Tax=Argentina anserina TaxID=57926 RepID=UPI0021764DDA|nr:putative FBD-associated F-box protein At5g22720 [Potentilla anserina]